MNLRNRIQDVIKLRSNTCQEFMRMVLLDNWQQKLYNISKNAIDTKTNYSDKYSSCYNKMRDVGIENYRVNDMDVTLMYTVVRYCDITVKVVDEVKRALNILREDRNLTSHSSDNEPDEELYEKAISDLRDLKKFIEAVDEDQKSIPDNERYAFRMKWSSAIKDLKNALRKDIRESIHDTAEIDRDIQYIKESNDPNKAWWDIYEKYRIHPDRMYNMDKFVRFLSRASAAGITNAHISAASYCQISGDYSDAIQCMNRHLDEFSNNRDKMKELVDVIRQWYIHDRPTDRDDFISLMKKLEKDGIIVPKNKEEALY